MTHTAQTFQRALTLSHFQFVVSRQFLDVEQAIPPGKSLSRLSTFSVQPGRTSQTQYAHYLDCVANVSGRSTFYYRPVNLPWRYVLILALDHVRQQGSPRVVVCDPHKPRPLMARPPEPCTLLGRTWQLPILASEHMVRCP